jgi:hypothetical protein
MKSSIQSCSTFPNNRAARTHSLLSRSLLAQPLSSVFNKPFLCCICILVKSAVVSVRLLRVWLVTQMLRNAKFALCQPAGRV